jgi:hypothetical protein
MSNEPANSKTIYWHRDLPPADAEIVGEHSVEATSCRIPGTLARRDELWDLCYAELMTHTRGRMEQEMARLDGDYAHVVSEAITGKHDHARNESWLHGRFTYVLYRRSAAGTVSGHGDAKNARMATR